MVIYKGAVRLIVHCAMVENIRLMDRICQKNAQRCRSETEKNILEDLFGSVFSQFKKYYSSENL